MAEGPIERVSYQSFGELIRVTWTWMYLWSQLFRTWGNHGTVPKNKMSLNDSCQATKGPSNIRSIRNQVRKGKCDEFFDVNFLHFCLFDLGSTESLPLLHEKPSKFDQSTRFNSVTQSFALSWFNQIPLGDITLA